MINCKDEAHIEISGTTEQILTEYEELTKALFIDLVFNKGIAPARVERTLTSCGSNTINKIKKELKGC